MTPATASSADVAVVGGGVIGLAVAWELARLGRRVVVLEREAARGGAASRAAGGMLAPLGEARRPGPFLRIATESLRRYPGWVARLEGDAGVGVGFRGCGKLLVALDAQGEAELRRREKWQRAAGFDVRWLEPDEVLRLEPGVTPAVRGGLHLPGDGLVHNPRLHVALARAAVAAGARVRLGVAVAAIEVVASRVRGVRLEGGERVAAERVVLAAGAWSGAVSGVPRTVPVRPVRGQMVQLGPTRAPLHGLVASPGAYLIPRPTPAGPSVVVGASEEDAGFEVATDPHTLRRLRTEATRILPGLEAAPVARCWAGLRPGTPDDLPIVGPDPEVSGLIHATGHFRNGILLAPATAAAVSALVTGSPGPSLDGLGPDRFDV